MLVQLELSYKCIRKDNLLDFIDTKLKCGMNRQDINSELQFKSIVTRYGSNGAKTYQIERIDFDRAPGSTFPLEG